MLESFHSDRGVDFEYLSNHGEIRIVKYIGSGGDVFVPNIINRHPVTRIEGRAFSWCAGITSVILPCNVKSIGDSAFHYCMNMTNIGIQNGLTSIGNLAFAGCFKLTSITLPASVSSIGENAFKGCASLSAINVDDANTVYCSKDGVLFGQDGIVLIKYPEGKGGGYGLPEHVTQVWSDAFSKCDGLTSIAIHANVTRIGRAAFDSCANLKAISVDPNNPVYCSSDGVLFNKSQTVLIQCPAGKIGSYKIPECITGIADGAFVDCASLTDVKFPSSVTCIGRGAFSGCQGLTNITIPDSVTSIDDFAFFRCDHLIPSGGRGLGYDVGKLVWPPIQYSMVDAET